MILRLLISAIVKIFVDIPMVIIGLFIVPIGLKMGFKGALWPWGNDDHPDNGGTFWKTKCGESWWCAYNWFALRNPCANFGKYVLGFKSEGKSQFRLGTSSQIGDTKAEGWDYACERWAWEIYFIKKYSLFGNQKCFRFRCGWKIMNKNQGEICAICFVISPYHAYSGS